jgi:hypothetical protein
MAGFDFWRGGDVTDRDNTDNGVSDEDAVWRDLVARYDVPLTAEEPVPWPEREGDPALGGAEISDAEISGAEISGAEVSGAEVGRVPAAGSDAESGSREPSVMPVPRLVRGARDSGGSSGRGLPAAADDDDDHFIPPPPPPLPKLDPLAKGAWVALFGGPGYLVVATGAGWTVPGFAAFCAVAAFVAGFAILVLRMNEPGPGGPDDGDDGAVV